MTHSEVWQAYYERTQNRPPRAELVQALGRFSQPSQAVDLGCGTGRDSLELLHLGWQVLAVDGQEAAIFHLRQQTPDAQLSQLTTRVSRFEELAALPEAMLINASYSLPFCHPAAFPTLWQTICAALLPNGRFVGTFFGLDDDWADRPNQTHLAEADVKALFTDFNIEHWHEQNELGSTASGQQKHWHVFTVIAQKR